MNLRHAVALANSICDSVSQGRRVGAGQPSTGASITTPPLAAAHGAESESALENASAQRSAFAGAYGVSPRTGRATQW